MTHQREAMANNLRELALEWQEYEIDMRKVAIQSGSTGSNKLIRAYLEAASPDVVLGLLDKQYRMEAVLRQALEALDDERYVSKYTHIVDAIAAIRGELGGCDGM